MKENKNNEVVKYILENYDIKNANDIADALKDMFKDTIQTMMNAEFDTTIVYDKIDNRVEKKIIEMVIPLKILKVNSVNFLFLSLGIETQNSSLKLFQKTKEI